MGALTDEDQARLARLRVLIVDDEYHARKLTRGLLQALGCRSIHEAGDGESALAQIDLLRPDLALLDWSTRGVNAVALLRRLRARGGPSPAGAPLVMLARSADGASVLDAIRLGVHDLLVKPVTRDALEARLLVILGRMRTSGAAAPAHSAA
jgi:CheY-like chemotaxis protein